MPIPERRVILFAEGEAVPGITESAAFKNTGSARYAILRKTGRGNVPELSLIDACVSGESAVFTLKAPHSMIAENTFQKD